ncbi:hypothetical protein D3C73_1665620 [compost metagenome]
MKALDAEWTTRGKTIAQLIQELKSFEDQQMVVEISIDGGESTHPISLVGKSEGRCLLMSVT